MSKIPFIFMPIPRYFYESGWFNNPKSILFVTWAFSKCSTETRRVVHDGKELTLKPYEFITGRGKGSTDCFLTEGAFRNQLTNLLKSGLLKKTTNSITNRFTCYIWVTERFSLDNNQQNNQQTTDKQPTEQPQSKRENIRNKELPPNPRSGAGEQKPFSSSNKKLIEICSGVRMTQSQLNECIASRGDRETVELIVRQILESKYKVTEWVGLIQKWHIKDNLASKLIENETLARKMELLYADSDTGWTCRIYNDKKKDCRGLLFEGRGAYVEPIFIPFSYYDFKLHVARIIREKKMQKSKEKQEQTCC